MEESYYPGEEPKENITQANGLTTEEMEEVVRCVTSKLEYKQRMDTTEHVEAIWKFVRWCVENGKGYDEFGCDDQEMQIPKEGFKFTPQAGI